MSTKRVTLRDLAKKIGVSHTTVSLALRDHPSILPARRLQIKQLAEKEGYRPDPFLSALSVYRLQNRPASFHSTLAWINHWEQPEKLRRNHREFDAYWRGSCLAAERLGYKLEEIRWPEGLPAKRFEQILTARGIHGLLIPPHPIHQKIEDLWSEFDWSKFSIVRFGLSVRIPDSHLVTADQLRATVMAMDAIHRRGYKKIGFILTRELDLNIGGNHTGGFFAAQKLFGVKSADSILYIKEADYIHQAARAKKELGGWLQRIKPDAVLTSSPDVVPLIRKLGYRIPEDLAVAGTSVLDISVDAGINQNSETIGRIAVEMLVAQINRNERGMPEAPCRTLVESSWQDGKSLPDRSGRSMGPTV